MALLRKFLPLIHSSSHGTWLLLTIEGGDPGREDRGSYGSGHNSGGLVTSTCRIFSFYLCSRCATEDLSHGKRSHKESSTDTIKVLPDLVGVWKLLSNRVSRGN